MSEILGDAWEYPPKYPCQTNITFRVSHVDFSISRIAM